MNNISDILVDLDGTISPYDGNDYFWDGLVKALMEKFSIGSEEAKHCMAAIAEKEPGLEDPNNIYRLGAKFGISKDELWSRAMRYLRKNSFAYPDAVRMVKTLHRRGFRLHMATNRFGLWLDTRLAAAGLATRDGSKYFSNYFDSKHGFGSKADKDYYKGILSYLKVEPNAVLMVGDSLEQDLRGAKNSGIANVVIVDRAQRKKLLVTDAIYINTLDIVPKILTELFPIAAKTKDLLSNDDFSVVDGFHEKNRLWNLLLD